MVGVLLTFHLAAAGTALFAFWTAAFADKGGRRHRQAGQIFRRAIYLAAALGGCLAVIGLVRPSLVALAAAQTASGGAGRHLMLLVLYLLIVIVAPVQHGVRAVAAAGRPAAIRSLPHLVLNSLLVLGAFALLLAGIVWRGWPFLIAAPAGFAIGLRNMIYTNRPSATREEWEREHLTSLITAGIGMHTALLALTSMRVPNLAGGAAWSLLPWIGPAIVGLPLIVRLRATRGGDPSSPTPARMRAQAGESSPHPRRGR
jgi:hypothetical protein